MPVYTACPKKSHHLDLTKQIGKNLSSDNYLMDDDGWAGNKLWKTTWCSEYHSFSFIKQPCWEDTSCGHGKDVNLFEKGQIIRMHRAKKTSEEIVETIKIGLRTVQHIIKNWKDSGEPSS